MRAMKRTVTSQGEVGGEGESVCLGLPENKPQRKGEGCHGWGARSGRRPALVSKAWSLTHAAWNRAIRAAHGNGRGPNTPPLKMKVAVWTPEGWVTGKVMRERPNPRDPRNQVLSVVKRDRDGKDAVFAMTAERWQKFVPTKWRPACPACGCACRPGKGSGTAVEGPDGGTKKSPDYIHFCERCEKYVLTTNPCHLGRMNPASPVHTEDPNVRFAPTTSKARGKAKAGPKAAASPPAGPPPKITAAAGTYRAGVDAQPHVMDTTFGFQNAFSVAAPGQAKAYYRDVALTLNDVHGLSESNLEPGQSAALEARLHARGHRMWAAHRTSRDSQKGTGTVIVARSTVAPKPGDGVMYTKDDGKAMAVALTVVDRPIVYLVMHLPHTDADQAKFLTDVRKGMVAAMAGQIAKTENGKQVGAPWARAVVIRAGDMNMTEHPLDNERGAQTPGPIVVAAMRSLDEALGCSADVYRTMEPDGQGVTHGKAGKGRRLDTFGGPPSWLQGPFGIVAHRELTPRATAYSYMDTSTRREIYKESDHSLIQITLRVSDIVKQPPRPTIKLESLRSPEVRQVTAALLERGEQLQQAAGTSQYHHEQHFASIHEEVLQACVAQQKAERSRSNRLRQRIVRKLERLDAGTQERWAKAQEDPDPVRGLGKYSKTERHVAKLTKGLEKQQHKIRRSKDAQAAYAQHMEEAGMGKAPRPVTRPEPVTRLDLDPDGTPSSGSRLTDQREMLPAVTEYYRQQLNKIYTPSAESKRDRVQVLAGVHAAMQGRLPQSVARGLDTDAVTHPDNVIAAILSLHRESTPGVDSMPLDFYIENLEKIAPQLSKLFREQLRRGAISETMRHAVLTPLYKEKGERHDAKMYRPVSVTTMEYRILAKCMALKLNLAVTHHIGDPQVGFIPKRAYDENIAHVRETIADINNRHPGLGGMILFLDNEKAFDRVQHDFMFEVLRAFHLPEDFVRAVETMYKTATTAVKLNGEEGRPFRCASAIRQGCPLSPLLYIYVQEVQMRMLREDVRIKGIPVPHYDGQTPSEDGPTIKERGLVDDIMVAVSGPESVPPLLETLDRFERMSNHKMNVDKTMLLLLGKNGGFDVNGDTEAARQLRDRGLTRTHDIRADGPMRMPDKWHGIILGNAEGAEEEWKAKVTEAVQRADSLATGAMPYGSKGRTAQAAGRVLGKSKATLQYTVPHDQKAVTKQLEKLQTGVNKLVMGPRRALTAEEAIQPRKDMGIGMVSVADQMAATWAKPLLAAMGARTDRRPYENYYAQIARIAYPEMGMGRELLRLNLGMHAVLELRHTQITGEMRQAFEALQRIPPMQYMAPQGQSDATERENTTYEQLVEQPVSFNPFLSKGEPRRATREEEAEMVRWARAGITRVKHVLAEGGTRVATLEELVRAYPGLPTSQHPMGQLRQRLQAIAKDLHRWEAKLAKGLPERLRKGEFRRDEAGQIWEAEEKARAGEDTVPAVRYAEHPHTGRLRSTRDVGSLPALRQGSEACVVTTTEPKPIAEQGAETAPRVAAALDAEEPHTVLAPHGAQAAADARTIGWRQKETATASRMIPLQGAGTAQVRAMLLAEKWEEPRVFKQGGRHAAMLAGVPNEERRARIGKIAAGMNHWAIPQEEGRHLGEAVHSGLQIGKVKCKGDKAMCAHCLKNGVRTEETAVHAHYKCPKAKAVWKVVIGDWNEKAGDQVSAADVTVAVAGLRTCPDGVSGEAKSEWERREPAWRLLHAVTLHEIYRARCRTHEAYHATTRSNPRATSGKEVVRKIKERLQQCIEGEHEKAKQAKQHSHEEGPMATFQKHWITSGAAVFTVHGPKVALLSPSQNKEPPLSGGVHLRTAAAVEPAAGKRDKSAGWLVTASDVGADGSEEPRLQAVGRVPTVAAMGSRAPKGAATRHTEQSTHQAAIWAALVYASTCLQRGSRVTLTIESGTAMRNLQAAPAGTGTQQEGAAQGGAAEQTPQRHGAARPAPSNGNKRQRPNPRPDLKRGRETEGRETGEGAGPSHTELNIRNKTRLDALSRRYPGKLELRAPQGATPIILRMQQAQTAARSEDVTFTAGSRGSRLVPLRHQTRVCHPGD